MKRLRGITLFLGASFLVLIGVILLILAMLVFILPVMMIGMFLTFIPIMLLILLLGIIYYPVCFICILITGDRLPSFFECADELMEFAGGIFDTIMDIGCIPIELIEGIFFDSAGEVWAEI